MTTEERIKKEAESYADSIDRRGCSFWRGMNMGYVAGATAERNKVIDDVLETLDKMMYAKFDRSELESLKTSSSLTESKREEK